MPRELSVDEDDDGARVALEPGDEVHVSLGDNGSGGYRWRMTVDAGAPLRIVDAGFTPTPRAVGSGGRAWWRLHAEGAGTLTLEARRSRGWQTEDGDARWHLTVEVRAPTR